MSLKFTHIRVCIEPSFCSEIYKRYIDKPTVKSYAINGEYQNNILHFNTNSFNECDTKNLGDQLILMNTLKQLATIDTNCIENIMKTMWESIKDNTIFDNHKLFNNYALIMYVDLKKFKFYYWCAFPILQLPFELHISKQYNLNVMKEHNIISKFDLIDNNYYLLNDDNIVQLTSTNIDTINDTTIIIVNDKGTYSTYPNWTIRNLLFALSCKIKKSVKLTIICYRESLSPVFEIDLPEVKIEKDIEIPKYFKGLIQSQKQRIKPDTIDMKQHLDINHLCKTALKMNNKLMKWKLVPELDLDNISNTKCLILGGGTLGCHVSRNLLNWAITNITFVDYGMVSHSTPSKQSLYFQSDIGKPKMDVIAHNFKKIYGDSNVHGINMTIPMPDYPIDDIKQLEQTLDKLNELYMTHDVVFLLTDTRESRWLPTLLGKIHNKPCFTSAIGFDTFVAMRHDKIKNEENDIACYFCSDIIEPINSTINATIDKKCTVSRGGVSAMASAMVSELMISCVSCDKNKIDVLNKDTIPQQIRGDISTFETKKHMIPSSPYCMACSDTVIQQYLTRRNEFIKDVIQTKKYLTKLLKLDVDLDALCEYPEE